MKNFSNPLQPPRLGGLVPRIGQLAAIAWLGLSAAWVHAQETPSTAPPVQAEALQWEDLRLNTPYANSLKQLWADKLTAANRQWAATAPKDTPFPAYTLGRTLMGGGQPVVVSLLFDAYDCELPGNGDNADLYSRCPLRIVSGSTKAPKVQTIENVCQLYVPPVASAAEGPDPRQNFTAMHIDPSGVLRLRVVQAGKHVPKCDLSVRL